MDGYVQMRDNGIYKPFNKWVHKSHNTREELLSRYIKPGSRVLNYGCGHGRLGFLESCEVVNFDVDKFNEYADYTRLEDVPGVFAFNIHV